MYYCHTLNHAGRTTSFRRVPAGPMGPMAPVSPAWGSLRSRLTTVEPITAGFLRPTSAKLGGVHTTYQHCRCCCSFFQPTNNYCSTDLHVSISSTCSHHTTFLSIDPSVAPCDQYPFTVRCSSPNHQPARMPAGSNRALQMGCLQPSINSGAVWTPCSAIEDPGIG